MKSVIKNEMSTDLDKLKLIIVQALSKGKVVLLNGGFCTGKSFLIDELFTPDQILATKKEGISGHSIDLKSLQKDLEKKGNIAVDEIGLLSDNQINYVLDKAVSESAGIAFASHTTDRIIKLINKFNKAKKQSLSVLTINLLKFDHEKKAPEWSRNRIQAATVH